jgi:multidrug efflux pump subunit AcrA (membrane-fusion protein)
MVKSGSLLLRLGVPVLILTLAVVGFAALWATQPVTDPVKMEEKAWLVDVLEVTPGFNTPQLLLYGTVEAPRQAGLSAAVAADVKQVLVAEGQLVARGQPLVILDDRDIALTLRQRLADVAEIEAMIDSERRRYESDLQALERQRAMLALDRKAVARAEDLNRRQLGSESLLDEARLALERQALAVNDKQLAVSDHAARLAQLQARLARAEALRDQARLDQERTQITAPFTGRIANVPVAPGDRVQVGNLLVELYATDELEIRAQIPFRYLAAVRAALETGTTLTANAIVDNDALQAELSRLSGETNQAVGGVDALFHIVQGGEEVVPGRLLPLVLTLPPEAQTVELPFTAIYGLDRIYRLQEGRMTALQVERIGEHRTPDGSIRVLVRSSALEAGDKIIVTQLPNAVTGLKVKLADIES